MVYLFQSFFQLSGLWGHKSESSSSWRKCCSSQGITISQKLFVISGKIYLLFCFGKYQFCWHQAKKIFSKTRSPVDSFLPTPPLSGARWRVAPWTWPARARARWRGHRSSTRTGTSARWASEVWTRSSMLYSGKALKGIFLSFSSNIHEKNYF